MNRITRAHILLWFLTIIASLNYTIAKIVMPEYLKASSVIWLRMSCTSFFFLIFILLTNRSFHIDKKDYLRLFFCGLFGVTLNQIFFYEGLSRTSPINASLMMAAIPVTVFILAALFLKEKMTWTRIGGLVLSASGAVLLLFQSKGKMHGLFIGDILVIMNAIFYGIFLIISRKLMLKYDSATIVFWIFLTGTILSFPYSYTHFEQPDWNNIPMLAWSALAFIIVFATILNYYLSVDVLKDVSPSIVSIYVYIQPIITAAIAVYAASDNLDMQKLASSVAILTGVYLVSKRV